MESTTEQWVIPEGTEVFAADGDKVGKVVAVDPAYLVVEKGWLFPTDYYVPRNAIGSYDGDKAYLTVTKDQALSQSWDAAPGMAAATQPYATEDRALGTEPAPVAGTGRAATGETVRVPIHEEKLTATKRPVEAGTVRINKDVVAEERTMDVPVTEEHLVVNRRVVDRDAPADAPAYKEDTIEIPLLSEEVDVQKRNRVVEEIEIGKEKVQRTERVAGTVRREEVRVDDAGMATGATTSGSVVGTAQTARWAPVAATDYNLLTGKDVYSAEGDKVGTIKGVYHPSGDFAAGVGRHYFLLDPGLLRDWFGGYDQVYLPESAIASASADRVDLGLTKDQIKGQDWTTRPADLDSYRWA
jgi:uncharacterized protein (TIGR02271 family)